MHREGERDAEHHRDERGDVAPRMVAQLRPREATQQLDHAGPAHAMPTGVSVTARSARAAAAREWVASRQAAPCSRTCSASSERMRSAVSGSRLPVGSSARISCGRWTRARAIATRCSCPPESVCGSRSLEAGQADGVEHRRHARRGRPHAAGAAAGRRWRRRSGAAGHGRPGTRSRGDDAGTPPARARRAHGCRCRRCARDRASMRSRPAAQFSSVDLPTPDSPTMATNSPAASTRSTSAKTVLVPKRLARPSILRTGSARTGRRARAQPSRPSASQRPARATTRALACGASQATTSRHGRPRSHVSCRLASWRVAAVAVAASVSRRSPSSAVQAWR